MVAGLYIYHQVLNHQATLILSHSFRRIDGINFGVNCVTLSSFHGLARILVSDSVQSGGIFQGVFVVAIVMYNHGAGSELVFPVNIVVLRDYISRNF